MKRQLFSSQALEYDYSDNLPAAFKSILDVADKATQKAYAPYSNFIVGAAVKLSNGNVFIGANQENASYPLCMCGERVALYHAAMNMDNEWIEKIAIVAYNSVFPLTQPVSPCGACRQVISEYENRQDQPISIILKGDSNQVLVFEKVEDLLPFRFNKKHLIGC